MAQKIAIGDLKNDFRFPPVTFSIDSGMVSAYLKAVEDNTNIYNENSYVPPTAVAALAMAAMGKQMDLPPGSIHVSQGYSFTNTINPGEILTSQASVKRNLERGKIHLLTIEINIKNEKKETVVSGETGFILPRL